METKETFLSCVGKKNGMENILNVKCRTTTLFSIFVFVAWKNDLKNGSTATCTGYGSCT